MQRAEVKAKLDHTGSYEIVGSPFALIPFHYDFLNQHGDVAKHIIERAGLRFVCEDVEKKQLLFSLSRGPLWFVWAAKKVWHILTERWKKIESNRSNRKTNKGA